MNDVIERVKKELFLLNAPTVMAFEGAWEDKKDLSVYDNNSSISSTRKLEAFVVLVKDKEIKFTGQGSTTPDDSNQFKTINEGTYKFEIGTHNSSNGPYKALNIRTLSGSPDIPATLNGMDVTATAVQLHKGYHSAYYKVITDETTGEVIEKIPRYVSKACLTVTKDDNDGNGVPDYFDMVNQINSNGYVVIKRGY